MDTFSPGMTTPVERMEAIMASLVQERSQMDRSNATNNKLNANLGSVQKREDTENRTSTIDNKEVANGELGSSMTTNATDNTTSKKRKRKKTKNNNPDLGGILSTHDFTQEGLSTTKVLEVTSGETISVSAKTATPDANIESKGDLSEVASGKMEESETTNNGNDTPKLTKSQRRNRSKALKKKSNANLGSSERREDTGISSVGTGDGKSPNSKETEHTKVGNDETSSSLTTNLNAEVEVQKKMEANPHCGVLSTRESTEEGLSTTNVLEVTIPAKTATPDANTVSKGDHSEVASGKMEETETTNNGNDAPKLTKSQKRNRLKARKKKLNANIGSSEKREDTSISSAGTGDGKNSTFEEKEHTKVAVGEIGSSLTTNLNGEVDVQKKTDAFIGETNLDINEAANTTSKKRKRKKVKNDNPDLGGILSSRETTEKGLSTAKVLEVKSCEMISAKTATPDANMASIGYHSEVASCKMEESEATNKTLENKLNANQGSLEKSEDTENLKGKPEIQFYTISQSSIQDNTNTGVSSDGTGDEKSSNFNVEVANGEMGSSLTPNLNREVEVQKAMETTIGNKSSGTHATDNTVTKKRKRNRKKMNNNLDLGGILGTCASTQEGLEVTCNETVSSKTTIPDANMLSQEVVANIKTGESETTNVNVNGKEKNRNKPNSENKRRTLAEILNPQSSQSLEASKCEAGSGTTSTDKPASNKQKTQKLNANPDFGITLSTRESTQEGSGTTKVSELKKDDSVSAKTATLDANIVPKEQVHTEVVNGKTGESETTNNGNDASKLTKSQKKNRRRALKKKLWKANLGSVEKREDTEKPNSIGTSATIDNKTSMSSPAGTSDLIGSTEVQKKMETSSGTNATDNTILEKRNIENMKNNNPDSGGIISTHKSTGEGSCTTKVLEVKSDETVLAKTTTIDPNMVSKEDHSEVANGETGETETTNLNASGKKKRKRKPKLMNKQPSKVLQAVSAGVSQGEDHMKDANDSMGFRANTNFNVNDVGKEETEPKVGEKKLIILDVNGLLADVVSDLPNDIIADKYITRRAIFKRPYVHEFLSFCFERFHVGIWSSRTMRNLVPVVNFLLGDLKKKLLFLWDGCKCTDSGIGSLDVQYKNIVVKDLRKIWDEDGPNNLWLKGTFNESNTLLVDDSPYKGLLNPKYTGIFPDSYSYMNSDDNFLGPNGELQTYLEGLAATDDVKTYVEQHPFGQGVIDEQNPDWVFYSSLIKRLNDKPFMECLEKGNQWKRRRCC